MPELKNNFLYKINYRIENNTTPNTLEIYARYSDLAAKAKQLDVKNCGSESQPVYFENGVPVLSYDLAQTQPVTYSYDNTTKIATITFSDWRY